MASLYVVNNFELVAQGQPRTGKQGVAADGFNAPLLLSVAGTIHQVVGSLPTANVFLVYDDDANLPVDWDYLYLWADQDLYVQLIGSASNVIFKVKATQPFVLPGYDSVLAAANTTPMSALTEPTLTDIDSVVLGNYSGLTANFNFCVID